MTQEYSLAKITKPGLPEVYERTRLFEQLDKAADRQLIWVAGPPGAGKTTLVCSYIESRKLSCLWYQIDESDSDLATFFHYLGLAAKKASPHRRKALPHLTPEYHNGLNTFTKRYFQDLFTRLKTPFALVFDDVQQVGTESRLHEAIRDSLSELPEGGTLILVSRSDPPPVLARAQLNQGMSVLGWKDLSLTADESRGIARLWGMQRSVKDILRKLHGKAEGWAAGLVLMLERIKQGQIAPELDDLGSETLFNYFAGEILAQTRPEVGRFLLETAFLPGMTSDMAQELTGNPDAAQLLADLNRNHYFTEKNIGREATFQYHPLFREFLLAHARKQLSAEELQEIQIRAARVLEQHGDIEAAVALMRDARDWGNLANTVIKNASALMEQGRYQTLYEWMQQLPAPLQAESPWISFWMCACRMPFNLLESRDYFEKAFELFSQQKDIPGIYLSWSGVVETYLYEWGNFEPLDYWIEQLDALIGKYPEFPNEQVAARVTASMFSALMYRQPQHPEFAVWEKRARALIDADVDPHHRVITGNHLILYYSWVGDLAKAALVIDTLRPAIQKKGVAPFTRIVWHSIEAIYSWLTLNNELCLETMEKGLALAEETGIHLWDFMLYAQGMYGALNSSDLVRAEELLHNMAATMHNSRKLDGAHYHYQAASLALVLDDLPRSHEHARKAKEFADESGSPFPQILTRLAYAQVLFERGEPEQAQHILVEAETLNQGFKSQYIEHHKALLEAYFSVEQGDEESALPVLRKAFQLGREHGFLTMTWWRPDLMSSLCAIALKHNIEEDYAHLLIRRQHLLPLSDGTDIENWPWAIRIYTLGRFSIVLDNKPLRFSSRAQSKPLELLKALIAYGGREVAEQRFLEALWPDAEGDAAHRAFDTTLHRLRKLIGSDGALVLQDGRLTLDPRYSWVDVWALERILGRLEQILREGDSETIVIDHLNRAFALYQGRFLGDATDQSWALALHDRLHSKFLRQVSGTGRLLEQEGRWEEAVDFYLRTLEIDALSEEFYQRLIEAYLHLGRRSEAVTTYNRCKTNLASILGIAPASATEALYRKISSSNQ